eukprot:1157790-Pelagomonas_calceolata.AAC.4
MFAPRNDEIERASDHSPGLRSSKNAPQLHPGTNSYSQKFDSKSQKENSLVKWVVKDGDLVVKTRVHAAAN